MVTASPSCRRRLSFAALSAVGLTFVVACLAMGRSPAGDVHAAATAATTFLPVAQAADRAAATADVASSPDAGGSIHGSTTVWSVRRFNVDLRKPRPPKHRSERPTTGADGIEAMMTASTLELMLSVDLHRPFVSEAADGRPLTGHYRSLLRPPAVFS